MNDLIIKDNIKIEDLIYEVRGKQVMIDSDLAVLYGCKNGTKEINQAVKNNMSKFPDRYCFLLNDEEYSILRSKDLTTKYSKRRYNPRVFTEQGVAMLATILKTKIAASVSIKIMDAFVAMRKYIANNNYDSRLSNVETRIIELDNNVKLIQESFQKLEEKDKINHIFFEGQIYDAYSVMMDILSLAKEEIIIIDNYAGKDLFDLLRDIKTNIKVYSKNFDLELIKKYNSQYSNISTFIHTGFHDRFIILDKSILYHCGSSFKDLGVKCFAINRIDDFLLLDSIINYLK